MKPYVAFSGVFKEHKRHACGPILAYFRKGDIVGAFVLRHFKATISTEVNVGISKIYVVVLGLDRNVNGSDKISAVVGPTEGEVFF